MVTLLERVCDTWDPPLQRLRGYLPPLIEWGVYALVFTLALLFTGVISLVLPRRLIDELFPDSGDRI